MKNKYYILALGMALAACDGEEMISSTPDQGGENEIRIAVTSAGASATTREDGAMSYDFDILKEEASWPGNENYFHIDAYFVSDLTKKYIDDFVMYNTYTDEHPWRICSDDGDQKTYYWPGTTAFDFFAYAPAMLEHVVTPPSISENGLTYEGFDPVENKHTLKCNLNYYRTGDQSLLKEFIYAYEPNQTYGSQGTADLTLHFQHPFAAIYLKISSAFQQLNLKEVKFSSEATVNGEGIYYEGTGTCSTDGTTWVKKEGAAPNPFVITINKTMGEDLFIGNIYENPYLVMPQPLTDREGLEDITLTLTYRKFGMVNDKVVTLAITSDIKEWESGKAYYYSLDLGKDESITVSASVEPWNEYGNHTVSGVDTDDPSPYDP